MQLCPTIEDEEINEQEETALRETVAATVVSCFPTAVQTAVTTARMVRGEDWSQEGRKLLREFGLPICAAPMMVSATF